MRTRLIAALLLVASAATSSSAPDSDRWLELELWADASQLARASALGSEVVATDVPGHQRLYLPANLWPEFLAFGLPHTVLSHDLAAAYARRAGVESSLGVGSMGGYFTLAEVLVEMDGLVATFPGLIAPRLSLGQSHEGRDLWAYKLSADVSRDVDEPEVLIVALMHAREPVGMMSLVHLAEKLLQGYGVDREATYLLDHRELWLVPVLNPDGYVRNETTNPGGGGMWRKNRRDNGGSFGVDINRNFGYEWGRDDVGSSPSPNSDTYRGPAAFSEPETMHVRDFSASRPLTVAVNTHAWGDHLIRPWAYENTLCPDDPTYEDVSRIMARGNAFNTGNFQQTLGYLANGDHDAWMYGDVTLKPLVFGFTAELGDANDGFWPAPSRIQPIVNEAEPMHRFFLWMAGPAPRLVDFTIDDSVGGDGDRRAEPGETIALTVTLRNHGLGSTWGPLDLRLRSSSCAVAVEVSDATSQPIATQANVTADTAFRIRLSESLAPGTLISFDLEVSDDRGPYPTLALPVLVGEPTLVFADDFESGTGNWTLVRFGVEAAGAARTGLALSDSPGGTYGGNVDASATLVAGLDLTAFSRAWIELDQRFFIDNDFDAATVETSDDAGLTWVAIAGLGSDLGSGAGAQPAGEPLYDGRIFAWTPERVDLSAHAGRADVRLRLRFRSNGSIHKDGWHVDDFRVYGFGAAATARVPLEPNPLLAVRAGVDVMLEWPASLPDPTHDGATDYAIYRSDRVRADAGFAEVARNVVTFALDPGAVTDTRSFAYQVTGRNCAGESSVPAR